jgi:hypothetical protein
MTISSQDYNTVEHIEARQRLDEERSLQLLRELRAMPPKERPPWYRIEPEPARYLVPTRYWAAQ